MKKKILTLLKDHPGCQVWVTHLAEERENGDLRITVGKNNYVIKREKYVTYEKMLAGPNVENDISYKPGERTCLIVFEKSKSSTEDPWDLIITQKPCPATQFVFSGSDTDLNFKVI